MELTLIETAYYKYNDWYWLVKGDLLVQFDHNYYLEFPPGNELHGFYMRRFKKLQPIHDSEGREVMARLIRKLNEITE